MELTKKDQEILASINKNLPDIQTNTDQIYSNYKKAGLQPKRFRTKEKLFEAVKKIMNTETINGKQISIGQALKKLFPKGYLGIPLGFSGTGSSKDNTRLVKEVQFNNRAFRERIPLEIQNYFKVLEKQKIIPKDSFNKYESYIKKGNKRNADIAKKLSNLTGIKFDKGHIFALFSKHGAGGSHDPASQIAELLTENRGKAIDNITGDIGNYIDTPPNWQSSVFEWINRQKGGNSGSLLPADEITGQTLKPKDIAKVTRHGADPNQVVASRWKKVYQEIYKAQLDEKNKNLPKSHNQIVEQQKGLRSRVSNGSNGSNGVKNGFKNGKQQILKVLKNVNHTSNLIPTPVRRTVFTAAALAPGVLGTAASAADVIERGKKYEESKNWLDGIQLGLANASLFTGWTGVGEMIATPADLMNLGLDAARFGTREADTSMRKRFRHGSR